jgi:adenosylcobyric acid synthase
MAKLYIVGTGPGGISHLTEAAREAIAASGTIIGYSSYIDLIRPLVGGKQIIATAMMQEVDRCRTAIRMARNGETVALVSGGDAGIYGMAGLVLELIEIDRGQADDAAACSSPEICVIPGISAIQAAASVLGAPLMHDFAVISLSDLLTPWDLIKARLEAAAQADFVIVIFNPRSKSRVTQIEEARRIILSQRPPEVPAGIVRNACREGEAATVTTLGEFLDHEIDMSTIVFIGNSSTFIDRQGRMVTPRGYARKYVSGEASAAHEPAGPLPRAGALMFCGTASDVGKSVITAGFCRMLLKRGIAVAPFKSQNMSLNSCVTPEGGEIGRAQAVQAQACDIRPHTDMNPILLKPNSDTGSQVIVQGRPVGNMKVREYDAYKPGLLETIRECYERLRQAYEFIVIEGAGSISEINLRQADIANLKVALMARCPVVLIADIDRGGVFAQIVGTIELLEPQERAYIKGIIINKFRGDASILEPGLDFIHQRTGIPVLGVLPWMADLSLPAEDSVVLGNRSRVVNIAAGQKRIHIGILKLPRISNFTDFDALRSEPDVSLTYVEAPGQLKALDVLIIPGSKSTIADMYFLMERSFYDEIKAFNGYIVGICGGYQILGRRVFDPCGLESAITEAAGFGMLPVETEMLPDKETHQALASLQEGGLLLAPECGGVISGYEIHMGQTTHFGTQLPFARIFRRGDSAVAVDDGSVSPDGRVFGTYLHGIFDNQLFREGYLNRIRQRKGMPQRQREEDIPRQDPFDALADHLEQHLDVNRLLDICGLDQ